MDERATIGVLGANSLVGQCVISRLRNNGHHTVAFSRRPPEGSVAPGVTWVQLLASIPTHLEVPPIKDWLCVAPIWVLPQYLGMIEAGGGRRVVALSSTSLLVKQDSPDRSEQDIARRLAEGEHALRTWAKTQGIEWVILRPTLIYGHGRDKNLTEIVRFVRRWRFFPLLGSARGLRQPVHAEDVATACLSALIRPAAANRTYNLSGGETLPYRDMVCRVFAAVGRRPRLLGVPRGIFKLAVAVLRLIPRYKHWTAEMAERMNRDLVFDHADAAKDLGYSPRPFHLSPEDMPT